MNEHPILMKDDMVRAILDDRKWKTRRLTGLEDVNANPDAWTFKRLGTLGWMTKKRYQGRFGAYFESELIEPKTISICPQAFPYGQVGDRLWVKETHVFEWWEDEPKPPTDRPIQHHQGNGTEWDEPYWLWPHYRATDPAPELYYPDHNEDEPHCRWKPSIFMPRWASRITLEIVNIGVERLQDIRHDDVLAEGIKQTQPDGFYLAPLADVPDYPWTEAVPAFMSLWNSINDKRGYGWSVNPWVWVIEFKRVDQ